MNSVYSFIVQAALTTVSILTGVTAATLTAMWVVSKYAISGHLLLALLH
jgi:hypothetical protein